MDGISALSQGTYDLITYIRSSVSQQWTPFVTRVGVDLKVATPVLSPAPGEYSVPINIAISTTTAAASIHYTTDGTEPTPSSPQYMGPIQVAGPGTGKVKAFRPGYDPSDTVIAAYGFRAATPVLSPPPGTYEGPVTVSVSTSTPSAVLRYTLDGSEPGAGSPELAGSILVQGSLNARVRAFRAGWEPSPTATAVYTVTLGPPRFSVASGTYNTPQSLAMWTDTSGATIRYTADGSDPTPASTIYGGPLAVPVASTIRARAYDTVGGSSSVSSVVINYVTADPSFDPSPGVFGQAPLHVAVSSATVGAILRYTLDGSEPSPSSSVISGLVSLTQNAILRVRAYMVGWPPSAVVSGAYEFKVPDPVITPESGSYARPFSVSAVVAPGASLRYTSDGSEPTETSPIWPGLSNASNGTYVIRLRASRAGWSPSAVVSREYLIADVVAGTPQIAPASGVHDIGVTVTISSTDPQATIRVTLDGSDPSTSSPVYSGSYVLNVPTTVKARAFKPGAAQSNIAGGLYNLRVPRPTVNPAAGRYSTAPTPVITHPDSNVTLRYTTDRVEPTEASSVVPNPCCIPIVDDTTLKVRAFRAGWAPSETVTNTYFVGTGTIPVSAAVVTFASPTNAVANVGELVRILISSVPIVPATARVFINDSDQTGQASVSSNQIAVSNAILTGRNTIEFEALDVTGAPVFATADFFGAPAATVVTVRSTTGAVLSGASVTLSEQSLVFPTQAGVTSAAGSVPFLVPAGAVAAITASLPGYHNGVLTGVTGAAATVVLSPVNENFQRGLEDWSYSYPAETQLRQHIEGLSPWICRLNCATAAASGPEVGSSWVAGDLFLDPDVLFGSWFSPYQIAVSRTLRAEPGTRTVQVRYRFFSHQQSLWYRISLTIPATGQVVEDVRTAATLQYQGLATPGSSHIQSAWLSLTVNLPPGIDEVRLTAQLPPDSTPGYSATWLEIDRTAIQGINMVAPRLYDAHTPGSPHKTPEPLQFLSLGPRDQSSGLTQVWGTIDFQGTSDRRVSAVFLDVSNVGANTSRATVPLRADVASLIVNQAFPSSGRLSTGANRELFNFTDEQMQQFAGSADERLILSVRALDDTNSPVRVLGRSQVEVLKFTDVASDMARYNIRDAGNCNKTEGIVWPCLGDAWARPPVHEIMRVARQALSVAIPNGRQAEDLAVDDFSNLNGGYFPPHGFHNQGRHIDAYIDGYEARDASVAIRLVAVASELQAAARARGWRLHRLLVNYSPTGPFADELTRHRIDGRPATAFIGPITRGHTGHFHVQLVTP